jgi:hypothetical protein
MEYSIGPSADGQHIVLVVVGEITTMGVMDAIVEAHALGAELGIRCYLMDATAAKNADSAISNFKFAKDSIPEKATIDLAACVAALVDPRDHSHDFFEAAAQTAGFDFTLFRDRDAAVDHLQSAADRFGRSS